MSDLDRDAILTEATRLHDLRWGNADCDRRYLLSCPRLQSVIFEAAENLRAAGVVPEVTE